MVSKKKKQEEIKWTKRMEADMEGNEEINQDNESVLSRVKSKKDGMDLLFFSYEMIHERKIISY